VDDAREAYLSDEAMAEHYAMYNVYLGLREATREASWVGHDCALSTLDQLDASAASWQARYADEDIEADRDLLARFAAILRERGAVARDGDCGVYDDDTVTEYPPVMACQAGGSDAAGATSLALIGLGLAAATRARRRGGGARA
jgi:hypothetical protein